MTTNPAAVPLPLLDDGTQDLRTCKTCGEVKSVDDFGSCGHQGRYKRRVCRACWNAKLLTHNRKPERVARLRAQARERDLREKFGITVEQYDQVHAAQGGVCAICAKACITGNRLAVDHCHESGEVRGLLCFKCNRMVGLLRDDPALFRQAAMYLRQVVVGG